MNYQKFAADYELECKECSNNITGTIFDPNYNDENHLIDAEAFGHALINCNDCGSEYKLYIYTLISKRRFEITFEGFNVNVGNPYIEDSIDEISWLIENNNHKTVLDKQLEIASEINDEIQINKKIKRNINIMNYAHIVSAFEGYLGAIFIKYVITHPEILKKFISNNTDYNDVKFKAIELIDNPDIIIENVKKYLDNFIFHKISKVKPLFKSVLGYEFVNIGWWGKAVNKRHDCVHRAGISKAGETLVITSDDIKTLIHNVKDLSNDLEKRLIELDKELEKNSIEDFNFNY